MHTSLIMTFLSLSDLCNGFHWEKTISGKEKIKRQEQQKQDRKWLYH